MTVGVKLMFWVAGRVLSAPWHCSEPAPLVTMASVYPKSIRNLLWTRLFSNEFSGTLDL